MLTRLKSLHAQVEAGIAEIATLASGHEPDSQALASARLRLSRISSERTQFIATTVYPALRATADEKLTDAIAGMSRDFMAKRLASSEHVTQWTSQAIAADWHGYRAASLRIRAMMTERLQRERVVLYGPLQRLEDKGHPALG